MRNKARLAVLAAIIVPLSGCGRTVVDAQPAQADAEMLHAAVQDLTDVIVYDIFSPPQASRAYAYASIAAYEAMRHADTTYHTLATRLNGLETLPAPPASAQVHFPLAGVHAFMSVGRALTFSRARMDTLRSMVRARYVKAGVPPDIADSSVAYGEAIAQHILAWASKDNFAQTRGYAKYTVTSDRGRWVPTPPAYMDAVEPNWARLRPFTLDSASQFRPAPPLPFDSLPTSAFYREAREVRDLSAELTEDQRALVSFWDDNPYVMHVRGHAMFATKKATPGGHWMTIAAIAARQANATLLESAVAYVRTAVALADGFISCWEEKFRSNVVRPETYINAYIDETWTPLLQTPPFPEYTSGHSVISTAAAEVLTDHFGDNVRFTDVAEVPYGLGERTFKSFRAAAEEAALSRLYGGIHYRRAVEQGAVQGRRVGEHVARAIRPRDAGVLARLPAAGERAIH